MSKNREQGGRVAAFFDIDGTLVARPSLERRFFARLRYRNAIPLKNYLLWLAQAVRLAPQGIQTMLHANKLYLRGVSVRAFKESYQRQGQPPRRGSGRAEKPVPRFFCDAVEQIAWHAEQGHAIVLVSGTLAPLAEEVALAVVLRLAVRGIAASVAVCATRLEEREGRWTGRIVGNAMFGEAKGRAVRQMAAEKGFELAQSCAYGDCVSDRWMLEAVGRASVVNPAWRLERLARRRGWSVLRWAERKDSTQISTRTERARRKAEEIWEKVG